MLVVVVRPPDKSAYLEKIFFFSTKTYIVGTQKNRLNDSFDLPKHMLKWMDKKMLTIVHRKYLPNLEQQSWSVTLNFLHAG